LTNQATYDTINSMSKTFPPLYHLGKNKALYSYNVWAENDRVYSDTGQVNGQRVTSVIIVTPKNVGRANATSAAEQAIKEAQAKYTHKLERKYSATPEGAIEEEVAPMLAQNYEKRKHKNVYYPADFQPKLDGVRAMAQTDGGKVILTSRGYKEWTAVAHINAELQSVMGKGDIFDGELYIHGTGFQTLVSWVKRKQPDTVRIEYHVYDMPSVAGEDSLIWAERKANLEKFFKANPNLKYIKYVPSRPVHSEADVLIAHDETVADGYEGGIVRLSNGLYNYGYRSNDLLKVKSFDDEEFLTVGIERGVGKFANVGIFICQTKEGKQFKAVPKASQEVKEAYLCDKEQWIGRMATVAYFGLTDDLVPRFPVLKGFRPREDS
jgi:DNA ligase-1